MVISYGGSGCTGKEKTNGKGTTEEPHHLVTDSVGETGKASTDKAPTWEAGNQWCHEEPCGKNWSGGHPNVEFSVQILL